MFEIFKGCWDFKRTLSSTDLILRGEAVFTPLDERTLQYSEKGSYPLQGGVQSFYQNRFFMVEGSSLIILKETRESLHQFDFGNALGFPAKASHTHPCGEDFYHCLFQVMSPTQFETFYTIGGAQKQEQILTTFWKKL